MSDAKSVKISVEACVLEVGAVVTLDVLDLDAIVSHGTIGESPEDILHLSLIQDYVHPSISRVIVNNDEAIEMCSSSKGRVTSKDDVYYATFFL
jgi:hypothetical protein